MSDIVISVYNVSKCYRVFENQRSRLLHAIWPNHRSAMREIWALRDINFEIRRGEAVAIIGRNGGGKSTLLEILTGTLSPTSGEITVNGRVSALLELGSGFNPEYTGRDNVILNGLLLGLTREELLKRFDEIIDFAEIGSFIDQPVKTYSSGMMMRLAFAVQVLCDPDILIIDEALSVGDFFFQQKCLSYLKGLSKRGVTLLFVSHDMGTVRDLCSKGLLLKEGQLKYYGDNLEAIRRYFGKGTSSDSAIEGLEEKSIDGSFKKPSSLPGEVWSSSNDHVSAYFPKAKILSVAVLDSIGNSALTTKIGTDVKIQVLFKAFCNEPIHVNIALKNKYDQIVTTFGSYTSRVPAPLPKCGQEVIFEVAFKLLLESGGYGFSVTLCEQPAEGTATVIDETPWLGPLQVVWNYQEDIPPFFGLVGLESEARFLM